jgi:PAS domain S-box-containing protein
LSQTFVHNPHVSRETAFLFENIGSIGWVNFAGFFIWFAALFSGRMQLGRSKIFLAAIFALNPWLLYEQWSGHLVYGHFRQVYGWTGTWSPTFRSFVFYIDYLFLVLAGLYFIADFRRKTRDQFKRRQAKILLFSALISLVLGTVNNVLLRQLGNYQIPPVGDILILIWALGMVYAILRYRFLEISPFQKMAREALQKANEELETRVQERTRDLSSANRDLQEEVTVRRKTEEELKNSEERLQIVFEFAPEAYFIYDLLGNLVDGNRKAEEITGYKREELVGQNFLQLKLLPLAQMPKAGEALALNAAGQPTKNIEFTLNRKDGSQVHVEISSFPIRIANRRLVLGNARDITQRKQAEEEKARLEAQVRQSTKMEAIGQLAGGIAHDFNNLLAAISGYAELARDKYGAGNPGLAKYVNNIYDTSRRAADLTSRLLAFARKGKFEMVVVDLHETIPSVIRLLEHTIDRRISLVQECRAPLSTVLGDPTQLQNAVLNLAVNARDAMPNGGNLTFSTALVEVGEEEVRRAPYQIIAGQYVRLTVSDTGVGMGEEIRSRLFEPFFTTKAPGKGTGLGLASVYGTVKSHNGYIDVASQPGTGSRFHLYLPLSQAVREKTAALPQATFRGSGTIMIVDDEEVLLELTSEMMKTMGYACVTHRDSVEAVDYYRNHHAEIDLVILDIIMPRMNGYDCFRELKNINPRLKALVMSGFSDSGEAQKILDAGALKFIPKPFPMDGLGRAVQEALRP